MTTPIYNPPSIDPAQRPSVMGTIQFIIDKMVMQEMDSMMPCTVVAVDRATNRASVQITVSMVTTANKNVIRAQVASIPIYSPSAGGFVINFPVKAGDLGWIKATDTDMSLFLQNLKQSPPNTNLMHKFDSSVFYPDNMNRGVTVAAEDVNNLVIQKYDGSVKVSMSSTGVAINGVNDTHALFDMHSTTQASIPWPRMTTAQRNAIPSPHEGMAIWNISTHALNTYNGTIWS